MYKFDRKIYSWRPVVANFAFKIVIWAIGLAGLVLPVAILVFLTFKGWNVIGWEFLSSAPAGFPLGMGGGIWPAIQGSLALSGMGLLIAAPIAIISAIYVNEYCTKLAVKSIVRYISEILTGIPSVVYGLFGYAFFVIVLDLKTSLAAGGLTLALLMFPLIFVGSREILATIDTPLRTAALSLGISKFRFICFILIPQSLPGIVAITLLAVAHAFGTAAPVLYTAAIIHSRGGLGFDTPVMTLPPHLYYLVGEAVSIEHAYGTALVLVSLIFLTSLLAAAIQRLIKKISYE